MKLSDHFENLLSLAPSHPEKGVKQNFSTFMKRFLKKVVDEVAENPELVTTALQELAGKLEDGKEEVKEETVEEMEQEEVPRTILKKKKK